jgi:hypothetical protein
MRYKFTKTYLQMTEAERLSFIELIANDIARAIVDHGRQLSFPKAGALLIKPYVDEYAKRVRNKSTEPWREDLRVVFERAVRQAPHIIDAFKTTGVAPVIGLSLAMLESEYQTCPDTPDGRKGLFLFTAESARAAGLLPTDRCDAPKSAQAAARSLASRTSEFGAEGVGRVLAVLAHRHGLELIKRDFQGVLRSTDQNNSFWALFASPAKKNSERLSPPVYLQYSLRFFAAAIIGETPEAFGLQMRPLSTHTREVK